MSRPDRERATVRVASGWRRVLLRAILGLLLLPVLALLNGQAVRHVLRIDRSFQDELKAHLTPLKEPLALTMYGYGARSAPFWKSYLDDLGLVAGDLADLPDQHPELIGFSEAAKLNPYPPLLFEVSEGYAYDRKFISFAYRGEDDRFHQLTQYSGEADTTPSIFVPKVRGDYTYEGDYFVCYSILLSRKPPAPGRKSHVQVDWIGWNSHRGGSYNGFEEMDLHAVLLALECIAVAVVMLVRRRWRR
ncbi:MAG: hypothetical protein GY835_16640 [bacterium]|nr:hypothetical protein [bacterium]